METEATSFRRFYSSAGNLTLRVSKGRKLLNTENQLERVEEKIISFQPQADRFGTYGTSDPEEIAFLENRMTHIGDVFDGAEYNRRTTPADIRVRLMEQELREIKEANRLMADMSLEEERRASRK